MIKDDFHTVCSWTQFPAQNAWKYDLLLGTLSSEVVIREMFILLLQQLQLDKTVVNGRAY